VRFQLFDQDGHRGAGQLQAVGGFGEAAQFDDTGEHAHGVETIQGLAPCGLFRNYKQ